MTEVKENSKNPKNDPFKNTAERVLKDFVVSGATKQIEDKENPPEKRKILFKGISPHEIGLEENIRKNLDKESADFKELVTSIRQNGILQSILVEERIVEESTKYVCVEGHRRILAAIEVGLTLVPCMVKRYSCLHKRTEDALAADVKSFLEPLDKADAYLGLLDELKSIDKIALTHGKDVKTIERYLKMATWPDEAKVLIRQHSKLFSTRFLLHNYVQKGIDGEFLIDAIKEKINTSNKDEKPKKNTNQLDSISFTNEKLFCEELKKQGINVRLRHSKNDIIATLCLNSNTLKSILDKIK